MNGQEKHTALIRTVILWRKRKKNNSVTRFPWLL